MFKKLSPIETAASIEVARSLKTFLSLSQYRLPAIFAWSFNSSLSSLVSREWILTFQNLPNKPQSLSNYLIKVIPILCAMKSFHLNCNEEGIATGTQTSSTYNIFLIFVRCTMLFFHRASTTEKPTIHFSFSQTVRGLSCRSVFLSCVLWTSHGYLKLIFCLFDEEILMGKQREGKKYSINES